MKQSVKGNMIEWSLFQKEEGIGYQIKICDSIMRKYLVLDQQEPATINS